MKRLLFERGRYFDSVFLLRVSRTLEEVPGVSRAVVAMGTPANLENLARVGFDVETATEVGDASAGASPRAGRQAGLRPDDLVIAMEAGSADSLGAGEAKLAQLLAAGGERGGVPEDLPSTLGDALTVDPVSNLALISVPGAYAAAEAHRALRRGLHVLLFSDNVSVEDEISLKEEAARRGLLVMGPDCGTAIVNGVPLGFANAVRRGPIGVVGASGTGIQEITSLIDRMGGGISHALGTGGRDLSKAVGGRTMLAAIDALAVDADTRTLVVVSKAPAPDVADRVLARLAEIGKPVVVHLVGSAPRAPRGSMTFADTLADAARQALAITGIARTTESPVAAEASPPARQGRLCGLFCGGTLAQEAWAILRRRGVDVRSNVATDTAHKVKAGEKVEGHVLWDLGDDAFTVGRPHPMIEPALRDAEVASALDDPTVSVVLVDCVLGYGAHPDPAGSLARGVGSRGGLVVASVTGTDRDPQGYREQRRTLEGTGIRVAESNAQAAEWCAALLSDGREAAA